MEGTPISGAASGWRRWGVCDPSLTQTSWSVFQWKCGGGGGGGGGDDTQFLVDFLLMTSSGLQKLRHALDCWSQSLILVNRVMASAILTNDRNQLKEVRGQGKEVQNTEEHRWWRQGLRSLAHAAAMQLCPSSAAPWMLVFVKTEVRIKTDFNI